MAPEELWNGNRERFWNSFKPKKEDNILRWAWADHDSLQDRYAHDMQDPRWARLEFVHLRSRVEAAQRLDAASAGKESGKS